MLIVHSLRHARDFFHASYIGLTPHAL
jgi:hypothetical protein